MTAVAWGVPVAAVLELDDRQLETVWEELRADAGNGKG